MTSQQINQLAEAIKGIAQHTQSLLLISKEVGLTSETEALKIAYATRDISVANESLSDFCMQQIDTRSADIGMGALVD